MCQGLQAIAFGDLFLEDIRAYREKQLQDTGLQALFPSWRVPTDGLAREMICGGLRARLVCIDPKKLAPEFAGREFDEQLLRDLPAGTDPCGEKWRVSFLRLRRTYVRPGRFPSPPVNASSETDFGTPTCCRQEPRHETKSEQPTELSASLRGHLWPGYCGRWQTDNVLQIA